MTAVLKESVHFFVGMGEGIVLMSIDMYMGESVIDNE